MQVEVDSEPTRPAARGIPPPETFHRLLQAGSRLYMQFARETVGRLGRDGGRIVREHLRRYGAWRGSEMRQAHAALGMPIDMETLNRCWDSASVFIVKGDLESQGDYSPGNVRYDVKICPAADVWRAEGFHEWGHVYCDEFHQACASAYHPDGNVVIPINMMKGDDHCAFNWIMPAGHAAFDPGPVTPLGRKLALLYAAESPGEASLCAMKRTSRLLAGRYWSMASALSDALPEAEADEIVRGFLRSWGSQRGALARAARLDSGEDVSPEDAVRGMDFAPAHLWDFDLESEGAGVTVTIRDKPMDDAWQDLDTGNLAAVFWQESLPAYIGAYAPDWRFGLTDNRWLGDPATVFEVGR